MIKLAKVFLIGLAASLAANALAVPIYTGDTFGKPIVKSQGAGYYIGSNKDQTKWIVQWTGYNAAETIPTWFGSIRFYNNLLGSTSLYSFESNQDYLDRNDNELSWTSLTNNGHGIDGFMFTVAPGMDILEFSLGSSLFSGLEPYNNQEIAGTHIYIGKNGYTPKVLVTKNQNGGMEQSFKIQVSEPASLALMGLGLIGLGLARRKVKA